MNILNGQYERIVSEARHRQLPMKLFGSFACQLALSREAKDWLAAQGRARPRDLDFFVCKPMTRKVRELFRDLGYAEVDETREVPDSMALRFIGPQCGCDVFLRFHWYVELPARSGFGSGDGTILLPSDLFLTKLIACRRKSASGETNSDVLDCIAMLGDGCVSTIDIARIVSYLTRYWKVYRAVQPSFKSIAEKLSSLDCDERIVKTAAEVTESLFANLRNAKKSLLWRFAEKVCAAVPTLCHEDVPESFGAGKIHESI